MFRKFCSFFSILFYSAGSLVLIGCFLGFVGAANDKDEPIAILLNGIIICGILLVIGTVLEIPKKRMVRELTAYYEKIDQLDPFGGENFDISTSPAFYNQNLSALQTKARAFRVARDLSVEFLGLRVHVVDKNEGTENPRKFILGKNLQRRRKGKADPLDGDERIFWSFLQKVKIRSAIEAKENQLPDMDKDQSSFPTDGTTKLENMSHWTFINQVYFFRGELKIVREWKKGPQIMIDPAVR